MTRWHKLKLTQEAAVSAFFFFLKKTLLRVWQFQSVRRHRHLNVTTMWRVKFSLFRQQTLRLWWTHEQLRISDKPEHVSAGKRSAVGWPTQKYPSFRGFRYPTTLWRHLKSQDKGTTIQPIPACTGGRQHLILDRPHIQHRLCQFIHFN